MNGRNLMTVLPGKSLLYKVN